MPGVARPRRLNPVAMADRRRQVGALYLARRTQAEIARTLQVTQGTVSTDLRALRAEWKREHLEDLTREILREAEELDQLEREAAVQFQATKAPEWLIIRIRVKERRAKLLGLDAPTRAQVEIAATKAYVDWPSDDGNGL